MTAYLAHAIVAAPAAPGPATGLRDRPLRAIASGRLALWATEWERDAGLTREDAFAHHDLVARLCDGGPCLPVRFGTRLRDEAAARAALDAGADRFRAALDRVGERREVAVTLLWRDAPSPEGRGHAVASSGRAFLERKRAAGEVSAERRRTADALAARLEAELAADRADVRHESCPSAEVAVSLSLLAPKGEADALKARATSAVAGLDGVRGVVSGPWPPYSFTGEIGLGGGDGS